MTSRQKLLVLAALIVYLRAAEHQRRLDALGFA